MSSLRMVDGSARLFGALIAGALVAGALVIGGVQAEAACRTNQPQDILDCLRAAYADRDSAAYADLLTEDVRIYNYGPDSTWFGFQAAVEAAASLFRRTGSLQLEFLEGWRLVPGESAGDWLVDSLTARVFIRTPFQKADATPIEHLWPGNQLYLKVDEGEEPRVWIRRWVSTPRPSTGPAADQR